jgi:HK97 gp10 family phage protein
MIDLNLNKTGINKLLAKFAKIKNFTKDETDQIFGYTASQISKRAKTDAPYKTGFLKTSINYGKNEKNVFVRAEAKYAPYLEYGTKPHIIKAKNKSVLYNVHTNTFFGKEVKHPGTKAQPFFYKNAEIEIKLMTNRIINELKKKL